MRLTPRQRVLAAVNHRAHDRVPVDIGANFATGFTAPAYDSIRAELGIPRAPGRIVSPNMVLWNEHHEGSDSTYWLAWEALNDDEPGGKDDFSRTMYMIWEDSARYFTSIGPVTSEEEQWEQVGTCTVVLIAAWDVVTWDHEPSTVVVQVVYLSMNQFRVNQVLREARVDDNGITDLIHERGFGYLPEYTDLYAGPGGDGLEHARSGAKKRR